VIEVSTSGATCGDFSDLDKATYCGDLGLECFAVASFLNLSICKLLIESKKASHQN